MKNLSIPRWIFTMLLIYGCASISTSSDYLSGTNFSDLKTYAWAPEPHPVTGDPRIDNAMTDSRIRNSVDNALLSKGYQKLTAGEPDFWVTYQAAIEGKLDITTMDLPYSVPSSSFYLQGGHHGLAYSGTKTFVNQYDEGTLLIDIINPKTKELMWRGTGKATVLEKATPEKREARISGGVQKILSNFPPNQS